jgi:cyclohexanone monooxygenase
MFMITGPGSPSVLSNMIVSIEQHVDWIADCLQHMTSRRFDCIEATPEAQNAWVDHVNQVAHTTLYPSAASWYMGANIPGKPRVFMPYIGGVGAYRQACDDIAASGYKGFALSGPATVAVAAE